MARDIHLPRFWIQPNYRSFNGIRGMAALMVFICHYAKFFGLEWIADFTWSGVDLFFVLSGFLITGILYDSVEAPRFFRNFYIRRALRIFPVFYGFFLLLFLFTPLLHLRYDWSLIAFPLYIGNLTTPLSNLRGLHNPTLINLLHHGHLYRLSDIGHLWSLCVEEQFYMIWPFVIWSVRDRKRLMHLCVLLSIAVLLGRIYLRTHVPLTATANFYLIYWSTYTRCDTLLVGAWLALWLRGEALSTLKLRKISLLLFWVSLLLLTIGIICSPHAPVIFSNEFLCTFGYTLVALAAAGLIMRSLDDESRVSRLLRNRYLSALGVVSYGFYFIHAIPEELFRKLTLVYPRMSFVVPFLAFAVTLLLAKLSFRYVETPFLRLKNVLAPQASAKDGRQVRMHVSEPEVRNAHSSVTAE